MDRKSRGALFGFSMLALCLVFCGVASAGHEDAGFLRRTIVRRHVVERTVEVVRESREDRVFVRAIRHPFGGVFCR